MFLTTVFEHFPMLEIWSKEMIGHGTLRDKLRLFFLKGKSLSSLHNPNAKNVFFAYLDSLNIQKGDILILHSSMDEIVNVGIDAISLIKYFLKRVGEEGTLVVPTFPLYPKEQSQPLVFDKQRTICWTGLLPNMFLRYPGVVRSEFPYNTLSAVGKHAQEMMKDNLVDKMSYGPHSAWAYCTALHAKVLLLGTPAFHTTTIAHIPEDMMGDKWPIKNFHIERKFILRSSEGDKEFTALIRDEIWGRYIKSHQRTRMLRQHGFLNENHCMGVYIGFIEDTKKVVDFLTEKALDNKTMYYVPRKYRKKI
ncbi:AAC(3) family N-acetyltransferase [Bacteroides oleiciplenus]|uniref:AAC(3) family N-acetyltransferase n=1 Tax=Bacteroides oleiciplenus TaxID=626931 RepID=UPI0026DBD36C|nr:AAC(3) family N-acetyltransferase [Bacteroides oleiciplenus]